MKLCWLVLMMFLMVGCSQIRQFTTEASKESLANAVTARQIADEKASVWSLTSGAIKCGIGGGFEESRLYPTVVKYDEAVKAMGKWSEEDYNRGCLLGLDAKLMVKSLEELTQRIQQLITQYGPLLGL